jgi:hypothetical protein
VKQSYPRFLISDGSYFVQAYITKQAFDTLKESTKDKDGKSQNITDLVDKVIILNKWTVEMQQTNSAENFTSYAGLEMRIIVHEMKLRSPDKVVLKCSEEKRK